MNWILIIKTFVVQFGSYLLLRLLYDRIVFGYIDLRQKSLTELVIIPVGMTISFLLFSRLLKIHSAADKVKPDK